MRSKSSHAPSRNSCSSTRKYIGEGMRDAVARDLSSAPMTSATVSLRQERSYSTARNNSEESSRISVGSNTTNYHSSNSNYNNNNNTNNNTVANMSSWFFIRRLCVEEETARRSRLHLQQLEAWKDLRVAAWAERIAASRQLSDRSPSPRSLSAATREGRTASSSVLSQRASSSLSPPPLPPVSSSSLEMTCDHGVGAKHVAERKGLNSSLLEKFYEGEVRREMQRRIRRQEREQWSLELADRRKREERRARMLRVEEDRRKREEVVALKLSMRDVQRQLSEEEMHRTRAVEEARCAVERADAVEKELRELWHSHEKAQACCNDAVAALQLRDEQMESLTADLQRMTAVHETLVKRQRESEEILRQHIEQRAMEIHLATQREAKMSQRLEEAQCALEEGRQTQQEREKAIQEARRSIEKMVQEIRIGEQRLSMAVNVAEEERRRAEEYATQSSISSETVQKLHGELQCLREEMQEALVDQAQRYEAKLVEKETAAHATMSQLKREVAAERGRCEEMEQELANTRREANANSSVLLTKLAQLQQKYDNLKCELQETSERFAGKFSSYREQLQEEVLRGNKAERVACDLSTGISEVRAALAVVQEQRDRELEQRKQCETELREAKKQIQYVNNKSEEQRQLLLMLTEKTAEAQRMLCEEQERSQRLDREIHTPQHVVNDIQHSDRCFRSIEPMLSPTHVIAESSSSFSSPIIKKDELRHVGQHGDIRDTSSAIVGCGDKWFHSHSLQKLFDKVNSAVEVLLYAQDYAVRQQVTSSQQSPFFSMSLENGFSFDTESVIASECMAKLRVAVDTVNIMLPCTSSSSPPPFTNRIARVDTDEMQLFKKLQQHYRSLNLIRKNIRDARVHGLQCRPAATILSQDPGIESFLEILLEKLSTVMMEETSGIYQHETSPLCSSSASAAFAHASREDSSSITRRCSTSARQGEVQPQHTFGLVGGRLRVTRDKTHLERLLLSDVVDTLVTSALGALSHRDVLVKRNISTPRYFEFTIRIGMNCDGLLIGFSDAFLSLEGFDHARNSMHYNNCYYLHLGRGTLYCPREKMVDVPYRTFQRATVVAISPLFNSMHHSSSTTHNHNHNHNDNHNHNNGGSVVAVRNGEEISCVLDILEATIRFRRGGVDCGVAFQHVDLTQPLFPAFEFGSRGCTIEFATRSHP